MIIINWIFSLNNETIDIQKPLELLKIKGLAKVKYIDGNKIVKQFNQEDIDDEKEKIILIFILY